MNEEGKGKKRKRKETTFFTCLRVPICSFPDEALCVESRRELEHLRQNLQNASSRWSAQVFRGFLAT